MKIILKETIESLGIIGSEVTVADGYARNYLLPCGLATVPTENNLRAIAEEKAHCAEKRIDDNKRIAKAVEAVEGAEAVLSAKA